MKIAILHYSAPPTVGGVETVLAQHASLMATAGHKVFILTGRGESFDERVRIVVLPNLDSRSKQVLAIKSKLDKGILPKEFKTLKDQIKEELIIKLQGFDILIAHNIASLHKNLSLTAALYDLYRTDGFPRLILWHHDFAWMNPFYSTELHDGYSWNLLRSDWKGATHVVVSEFRRSQLSSLLKINKEAVRVIPNGLDLKTFYKLENQTIQIIEKLKLYKADPLFLMPVRLTPRKNIEFALKILTQLREYYPMAVLLVTGQVGSHNPANRVYMQKLLKMRDDLNLQGAAHFLAEISSEIVPNSVIADFYRFCDALLLTSTEEGFGIPLIEAAVSTKPVFCSDIEVLRELGGRDINYFDIEQDPEIIARKIIEKLENDMTSRWARRAKQNFTWERIFNNFIEPLLKEVGR